MKAVDSKTMKMIDASAVKDFGMDSVQLMENAGRGIAELVVREFYAMPEGKGRVAVVTGKGNNGGDGFVVARHLMNSGVPTVVFSLEGLKVLKGDAALNAGVWQKMGGETRLIRTKSELEKSSSAIRHSAVIVDAILGTGLKSPVKGHYAEVIRYINGLDKRVVAVDIPSGLDATTGQILGVAVRADFTATMALPKTGFFEFPGRALAGRVEVIDIGVPSGLLTNDEIHWNVTVDRDIRRVLKPRADDSHKGTCGHLLVLAGSPGKTGAAYMTSMGAMRSGAGLTTLGLPESLSAVMEAKTTEVMTCGLPETPDKTLGVAALDKIGLLLEGKSAVVVGPGLGATTEVIRLMEKLVRMVTVPMVIDADGLNSIEDGFLKDIKTPFILTPHPGEAARLLKTTAADIQADRTASARRLAKKLCCTVVLKGACTVIAEPSGTVHYNTTGNAGLATAGTGDVLSGMIGGLIAQGYAPVDAAVAAVYVHGLAADEIKAASGEAGMIATDLLARLPGIINSFTAGARS